MTSNWMTNSISFISPDSSAPLVFKGDCFIAPSTGETFPIINNIPRFVPSDSYSNSFGIQWNRFRLTQLDSHTGLSLSRDRLTRIAGGSLDIFKNSNVLEAGCGAGRFTEIMLDAGARVWAEDLSTAVEANYQNCHLYSSYFICQADILSLPIKPEQFDIVVCIGVIQHTPDPEQTIRILYSHVKPGGTLLLDHYSYGYPISPMRRFLRTVLLKTPEKFRISFVKGLVTLLWPIHRASCELHLPGMWRLRKLLLEYSPIVDYQDAYPKLGKQLLYEWSVLDTHDTLTDYYKHLRSADEIASCLSACGMTDIKTGYAGNGVEARARKPLAG